MHSLPNITIMTASTYSRTLPKDPKTAHFPYDEQYIQKEKNHSIHLFLIPMEATW
jgi:hypothetical protein